MSEPERSTEPDASVAAVLEGLRAGVRQRQAELACLDQQRGDLPGFLAAVRSEAILEEPSFRTEGIGALRSFLERAAYVLFARRQHRALLRQQNRFNRSVQLALEELHARQEAMSRDLRRMAEEHAPPAADPRSEPGIVAPRVVGRGAGSP
jgi:hypothetical protein